MNEADRGRLRSTLNIARIASMFHHSERGGDFAESREKNIRASAFSIHVPGRQQF
jgi:hypothetical protein